MLTPEEENKLMAFYTASREELIRDTTYNSDFYVRSIQWLAAKLKEVNNEAAKYSEELYEINNQYALHMERCEGL